MPKPKFYRAAARPIPLRRCVHLLLCAVLITFSAQSRAAWQEGFETPDISWKAAKADVAHRELQHQRVAGATHSGKAAELIQIEAADGTYVRYSHEVPPSRIVAELVPSVWVNANRPGIQILARIVLPNSIHPSTGKPITTLIRGTSYSQPDRWQQLRITDTPQLLSRQLRVLRAEIGPSVDETEAYIDQVWLNVYSGPGQTTTLIDDLELAGSVPRTVNVRQAAATEPIPNSPPTSAPSATIATSKPRVALSGSNLQVDGRAFFPRIIEAQGEPLAWLKELGFNAVRLKSPPTAQMLEEARQAGLWLVAPPPEGGWQQTTPAAEGISDKYPDFGPTYDSVLAWHLGSGLTAAELPDVAALAKQLRNADRRAGRPLVCDANEELFNYSSHVQILSAHRSPLATGLELIDYGSWLKERPRLARPGKSFWTVIQTEPPPAIVKQAALLGGPSAGEPTIDADALRLQVYQALAAGVRGMEFASSSRLDAADTATRIRALSLALLNLELELLTPWAAAGTAPAPVASQDANLRGVIISADQTRLLIGMRCPKGSQYVAQPMLMQTSGASFVVAGIPESHDAYELTLAGVRRLRHERISGGTSVAIEDFPVTGLAFITSDPIVVKTMTDRVKIFTPRALQLQRELAIAMLAESQTVQQRLAGQPQLPPSAASINASRTALARADQLIAAKDFANAYFAARNAAVTPQRWRREVWNRAATMLGPPESSPLAATFTTLPDHLNFVASLAGTPQSENLVVGGEFEDLQAMLQAGWQNYEHAQQQIKTSVELSPQAPFADRFCLRLQALPADPKAPPVLVESPLVWVTTAPLQLEAGDVVCIRGQARVTGKVSGSVDGLMILDSFGGEALAQRIDDTPNWREFVMYRAAPQRGPLTVTFALTGVGEASLDNFSIRVVRRGDGQRIGDQSKISSALPPALAPRQY